MIDIKFIKNVYPGEDVKEILENELIDYKDFNNTYCIGIDNNKAIILGQLSMIEDNRHRLFFIKSKTQRYVPRMHDIVIGKIFYVHPDYYKVDLGRYVGILPALSFPNATKRNKPELIKNDLVLCRVLEINNELDREALLTCTSIGMGKIEEAFEIEPWKVRLLYFDLKLKKIQLNFRIALAMNGLVYIEANEEDKKEILNKINNFYCLTIILSESNLLGPFTPSGSYGNIILT